MIWILLTFFAFAETDPPQPQQSLPIDDLATRAVSTVVEARVIRQFTDVPQIAKCLQDGNNLVKEGDLTNGSKEQIREKIRQAQINASNCVTAELENVKPEELEALSQKLGLRDFGLVKGEGSKAVVNFFSERLQKEFFTTRNGKPVRMVVDQALFFDMYESQLGKSVLLELSNYCVNSLNLTPAPTSRKLYYDQLKAKNTDPNKYTDTYEQPRVTRGPNDPPEDPNKIYEDFISNVLGTSDPRSMSPDDVKKDLGFVYETCAALIPSLCKVYNECECEFRKKNLQAQGKSPPDCVGTSDPSKTYEQICVEGATTEVTVGSTKIKEPNRGRNSCHVEARLRAYRGNLTATNRQQALLRSDYAGGKVVARNQGANIPTDLVYQGGEQSIDDLTSLSSKEIDKIQFGDGVSEECVNDPTKESCKDFAYGEDETSRFSNTAASYAAVTAIEVKKLKNVENDKTKLVAFLKGKGYLDLAKKVEDGENANEIVKVAAQRFESQREATFGEISKAFERRQLVGDQATRESKVKEIKSDLENRGNDFKQLMLFNNVVTSFLNIEKKNSDGKYESAGTNIKALQREISGNEALEGLSGLAGGTSQVGSGDSPIVDQTFIDNILGESNALTGSRTQPPEEPR